MIINWNDHLSNLRADPKYKPVLPPNTLDHCLAIIPAVKIQRNEKGLIDSLLMFKPLQDDPTGEVRHINGTITNKEYLSMVTFLGGINRSKLVPSMKKDARLGSLTPLVLYAYKLNHDIPYSAWDREAKWFSLCLGKFLAPLKDIIEVPALSTDEIVEYRDSMQTVRTTGLRKTNVEYRSPLKNLKGIDLPAPAVYMLLQLWIANTEFRNTDAMILDPLNWDNIPDSIDNAKVAVEHRVKEWWE